MLGTIIATFDAMKPLDIIIINFACGAPFAVYYFIQNRERRSTSLLWLKTSVVAIFWILFAIRLFHERVTSKLSYLDFANYGQSDSQLRLKIEEIEKRYGQVLVDINTSVSIFGFRETFNRYCGLTLSNRFASVNPKQEFNEIYKIVQHENIDLASRCLSRRNRLRLERHQTNARRDLVVLLDQFGAGDELAKLTAEFAEIIADDRFNEAVSEIFGNSTLSAGITAGRGLEENTWNPIESKQRGTSKQKTSTLASVPLKKAVSKAD